MSSFFRARKSISGLEYIALMNFKDVLPFSTGGVSRKDVGRVSSYKHPYLGS